jgi:mono/diheme cytochrome c family protein
MRRITTIVVIALAVLAAGAQFVQPEHTNPPSDPAASFAPPGEAAAIIERSCADCHSNRTVWPWYSKVAPASWLVAQDVKEGRARLNFSEWSRFGPEMARLRLKAVCKEAAAGEMPPFQYTLIHRDAKLGEAGVAALCGLKP